MVKAVLIAVLALCLVVDNIGFKLEQCPPGYRCRKRVANPMLRSRAAQIQDEVDMEICLAGTYSPGASEDCKKCDEGTFAPNPGAPACYNCPKGYMCPNVDKLPEPCPVNSYNNVTRQTCCHICPPGKFAGFKGMFQCDDCHSGMRCPARQKLACEDDGTTAPATTTPAATTTNAICVNGDTAITFDDLSGGRSTLGITYNPGEVLPSGYNNMYWTNAYFYSPVTNATGYYTAMSSKNNTVYNGHGDSLIMKSVNNNPFTLYSMKAAAAWNDNLQLTVVGYRSNTILASNSYTLQVFMSSYLAFDGYSGLDTVVFSTSGGTKNPNIKISGDGPIFAMDNICLTFT